MRPLLVTLLVIAPAVAAPPIRLGDGAFRIGEVFGKATLSPDGRHFAVAGGWGRFHLLDAETGGVVHSWKRPAWDFAFDGRGRLRVLDGLGVVRTFDVASGGQVAERTMPAEGGYLAGGGRYFLQREHRADRQVVATIDCDTGRYFWTVADPATHSDDGRWLLSVPERRGAAAPLGGPFDPSKVDPQHEAPALFDLLRGVRVESARLPDALRTSETAWFTPDGRLAFRLDDRLFEMALPDGPPRSVRLEGLRADIAYRYHPFAFSPDGRRVAAVVGPSEARAVAEWDRATGRRLGRWPVAFGARQMLAYAADGRLRSWNWSGVRLDVVAFPDGPAPRGPGHAYPLVEVAYTRDGGEVHSLDERGHLLRWDARTGRLLDQDAIPPRHLDARPHCRPGCLDPDRRLLRVIHNLLRGDLPFSCWGWLDWRDGSVEPVAGPPPGQVRHYLHGTEWWFVSGPAGDWLYEPPTGRRLPVPAGAIPWANRKGLFQIHAPPASPAALVVAADAGGVEAFVLDVREPRLLGRWSLHGTAPHERTLLAPDGSALALSGRDGVTLFEARTGRPIGRSGPAGVPLAFAPDGRTLLCLLGDEPRRELALVEVATRTARCRWSWTTLREPPASPAFRPDGRQIAYPLGDGTVLLLATDSDRADPPDPWPGLASPDAAVADAAVRAVAARPDALDRARARLGENVAPEPTELIALLSELDHDDPNRRDAARDKLRAVPAEMIAAWRSALVRPSAELLRALDQLLDEKAHLAEPTADDLRRLRLAEALGRAAGKQP